MSTFLSISLQSFSSTILTNCSLSLKIRPYPVGLSNLFINIVA